MYNTQQLLQRFKIFIPLLTTYYLHQHFKKLLFELYNLTKFSRDRKLICVGIDHFATDKLAIVDLKNIAELQTSKQYTFAKTTKYFEHK